MSQGESIPIELINIPNKSILPAGDDCSCSSRIKISINFRQNPKQVEGRNYSNKAEVNEIETTYVTKRKISKAKC